MSVEAMRRGRASIVLAVTGALAAGVLVGVAAPASADTVYGPYTATTGASGSNFYGDLDGIQSITATQRSDGWVFTATPELRFQNFATDSFDTAYYAQLDRLIVNVQGSAGTYDTLEMSITQYDDPKALPVLVGHEPTRENGFTKNTECSGGSVATLGGSADTTGRKITQINFVVPNACIPAGFQMASWTVTHHRWHCNDWEYGTCWDRNGSSINDSWLRSPEPLPPGRYESPKPVATPSPAPIVKPAITVKKAKAVQRGKRVRVMFTAAGGKTKITIRQGGNRRVVNGPSATFEPRAKGKTVTVTGTHTLSGKSVSTVVRFTKAKSGKWKRTQ